MEEAIYMETKKVIKWHYQNLFKFTLSENTELLTKEFGQVLRSIYEEKSYFLTLLACHKAFMNNRQTQQIASDVLFEWFKVAQEKAKTEINRDLVEENEELMRICLIYWKTDGNYVHTDLIEKAICSKLIRLWDKDALDYIAQRIIEEIDKLEV